MKNEDDSVTIGSEMSYDPSPGGARYRRAPCFLHPRPGPSLWSFLAVNTCSGRYQSTHQRLVEETLTSRNKTG